jgi:hypothetical protein
VLAQDIDVRCARVRAFGCQRIEVRLSERRIDERGGEVDARRLFRSAEGG